VRGIGTKAVARADSTVVVAEADGGPVAFTVKASSLELRSVRGLDPALGIVEVTGDLEAVAGRPVDWEAAVSVGQLAVGHELVGLARAMLELARQHALDRVQFGRPISSFQAIRHRLAESLVAVEAADGLLAAAWDDPTPVTAAMAKAMAGRSARAVARHAQQVLAGIGFTTEHPFHRYVRRTIVLDQLLGASSVLTRQLGEDVLARATLPPTLPL
jgi:alkylation response protein AidB-like acyl-CoA dehydrogenase